MAVYLRKAGDLLDRQIKWTEEQLLAGQATVKDLTILQWTGSISEWVELVYALHATGRINKGTVSLKTLFHIMGTVFDLEVKEHSNYFMAIKNRKDGNRTKLMDLMKKHLLGRMTEADQKPSRK